MSIKKETLLQESIQELIEKRGGYVNKNHGSMISKVGRLDLSVCYKGLYLDIEVKVDNNKPSEAQGIHCRNIHRADGITLIAWSKNDVIKLLDKIDEYMTDDLSMTIKTIRELEEIDNGRKY